MSSTETDTRQPLIPKRTGKTVQDTRIDAAHSRSGQDPQPKPAPTADAPQQAPMLTSYELSKDNSQIQRIERQAAQLAEHLRNRQKDLDHRESQLNAAISQLESDLRNARMWLTEQDAEHAQRQQQLDAREKELLQHLQRLAAAEAALKRQSPSKTEPNAFSTQLQLESGQLAQQAAALREDRRQGEIQRQRELETADNRLAQAHAEIQKLQEQLTADRRQLQEEIHLERQRLIVQQRQFLADMENKRRALQDRSEQIDQRRAALVQLRAELQQMHRETLEICLAAEELCLQLSAAAPPAALTRSLSRIRARLADQYRLAKAELRQQRKELENIRDQLAAQYEKLLQQKRQFEHCTAREREEYQQQSLRLLAREQELLKQQSLFGEQSERWQVERMQYEQEIRRLRQMLSGQNEQTA